MFNLRALRPVGERVPLRARRRAIADSMEVLNEQLHFDGYRSRLYESGTAALAAAVEACVKARPTVQPEVLVPAFACPDIVSAVRFAGATPVLVDTVPQLPWMDPSGAANATTPATVAVVHMRFLGLPGNAAALRAALGANGPVLIEDAAHWFPIDRTIDSVSDFVIFSFGRGKPVSVRHGGQLLQREGCETVAGDPQSAPGVVSARSGRLHLMRCAAYNAAIQPTVYGLLTQMLRLPVDVISYRKLISVQGFNRWLAESLVAAISEHRSREKAWPRRLSHELNQIDGPWIDVAVQMSQVGHGAGNLARQVDGLWRYPLLLESERARDRLFHELRRAGLGPSRMYRRTLGAMPTLCGLVRSGSTPNANEFARRLLTLPLHSGVTGQDAKRLIEIVRDFAVQPLVSGPQASPVAA